MLGRFRRLYRAFKQTVATRWLPLVWRVCVRVPGLPDLYYCFSSAFRREHRAVLLGKLQHQQDMHDASQAGAEYTLRRNIHRLEKGIISRPRRSVFAADYIGDTVGVYLALANSQDCRDRPLIQWARDVLGKYFDIVGEDARVDPVREKFVAHDSFAIDPTPLLVPYQRDQNPLRIDYEGLAELAWRRRSVRWYLDKPVPRDIIDRAIEVAKLSPSACNRQPFEFRVFDDPKLTQEVADIPGGTKGFSHNFPCVIVIVGDLRAYFSERDRHVIYVDGGLAAMAFQFALEVQGVSSCCINWPDIESREQRMAEALNLDPNQRPIMCLSLGFADPTGQVPYSQKKSLDEIRSYNKK